MNSPPNLCSFEGLSGTTNNWLPHIIFRKMLLSRWRRELPSTYNLPDDSLLTSLKISVLLTGSIYGQT
ncbi:MAG: hypothetical protein QW638_08510 [Candidatus Bathyarchaeia archaeon]